MELREGLRQFVSRSGLLRQDVILHGHAEPYAAANRICD